MGLGGNLGDPLEAFSRALDGLASVLARVSLSRVFRTEPVAAPGQPDFLNAVALGRTRVPPGRLLALLLDLELREGRRRDVRCDVRRNEARPLDLDLLLYGRLRVRSRRLVVPHPRMHVRRFVLAPLAELAPHLVVPGVGRRVSTLLRNAPSARVVPIGELGALLPKRVQ